MPEAGPVGAALCLGQHQNLLRQLEVTVGAGRDSWGGELPQQYSTKPQEGKR